MTQYIGRLKLAKNMAIDERTLDRWVNPESKWFKPDFPRPIKIGRNVLYNQQEVDDYLDNLRKSN